MSTENQNLCHTLALTLTLPMNPWEHRTSNIQHPTPNRQSMPQLETIGCSILDVGCWMFSFGSWVQCAKFSGNSLPHSFVAGRRRNRVSPNLCRKCADLHDCST